MTYFTGPSQEHAFGPFERTHEGPGRKALIFPLQRISMWAIRMTLRFEKRDGCWRVWSKDKARGSRQKVDMPKEFVDQVPCAVRLGPDTLAIKLQNRCTSVMQCCLIPCTKLEIKHRPSKATNTTYPFCLNLLFSLPKHQPKPSINRRHHHTCWRRLKDCKKTLVKILKHFSTYFFKHFYTLRKNIRFTPQVTIKIPFDPLP